MAWPCRGHFSRRLFPISLSSLRVGCNCREGLVFTEELVLDDFSDFTMENAPLSGCETDSQNEPHGVDEPGTIILTADRKIHRSPEGRCIGTVPMQVKRTTAIKESKHNLCLEIGSWTHEGNQGNRIFTGS